MTELTQAFHYTLNNNLPIPAIGYGTWRTSEGDEVEQAVTNALGAGYRFIDTAKIYGNEVGVGKAILASGIPRQEIFLATKVWNEDQGYDSTLKAFEESLGRLGMDYVDLYLVHWPFAAKPAEITGVPPEKRRDTWKAMEEIYASGRAKSIGVSNYTIKHLEEMKEYANTMPVINQVEFNPFLYQKELLEYCDANGIRVQAYSPLVHGERLNDPRIAEVAGKYGKSNAQVLIRWSLQHGCIPIPKSLDNARMKENLDVFNFELSHDDMQLLDSLNEDLHLRADPNKIDP